MRRIAAAVALAVALSGAQAGLLRHLGGGRWTLALPVLALAWAAAEAELLEGVAMALGVGLVLEAFAGTPRGMLPFLAVAAYLACRVARTSLAVRGPVGFGLLTGAADLLLGAGALLLGRLAAGPETRPPAGLLGRLLVEALLTAVAAGLLQPLVARLDRALAREAAPDVLSG